MKLASRLNKLAALGLALWWCLATPTRAGNPPGLHYKGQVLYRANKKPVPGVLVEIVPAGGLGEELGSTHTDAEGRFTIELAKATDRPIMLAVSAVRESADSGGDRRDEGYKIKTHRTLLGFMPDPHPTKPNTILIERRQPGHGSASSDD